MNEFALRWNVPKEKVTQYESGKPIKGRAAIKVTQPCPRSGTHKNSRRERLKTTKCYSDSAIHIVTSGWVMRMLAIFLNSPPKCEFVQQLTHVWCICEIIKAHGEFNPLRATVIRTNQDSKVWAMADDAMMIELELSNGWFALCSWSLDQERRKKKRGANTQLPPLYNTRHPWQYPQSFNKLHAGCHWGAKKQVFSRSRNESFRFLNRVGKLASLVTDALCCQGFFLILNWFSAKRHPSFNLCIPQRS